MVAPILVFGWGNPSRGDDALGPVFIEAIEALALPGVECLTDFQLQVEHALDLRDRQQILFVDTSIEVEPPFTFTPIGPCRDSSYTTHFMSPQAVLQVYCDLDHNPPPPSWLLAIRGESFELGESLSPSASHHLRAALEWSENWLRSQLNPT